MSIQAYDHYDRKKSRPLLTWEFLTFEEVKALHAGDRPHFQTSLGDIAQVKVTSIKTWKTRPGNIHLGVKYGQFDFSYVEFTDGQFSGGETLVKEVTDETL